MMLEDMNNRLKGDASVASPFTLYIILLSS